MRNRNFSKRVLFAVAALACPVIALSAALIYQSIVNAGFWRSVTAEESAAGAMMGFGEVVQLIVFSMIGCLVGLIFAVLSIRLQRRLLGIGLAALVFNGLPLLLLMALWIKGMTRGL